MGNYSIEHLILMGIVLLQLLVVIPAMFFCGKIKGIFSKDDANYLIGVYKAKNEEGKEIDRPLLGTLKSNKTLDKIRDRINSYLIAYYQKKKSPDIAPLESLIRNESKVYDSIASLFASFPILIGLAGTITGLIYAFTKIESQNKSMMADDSGAVNFLSLISQSSSVVFWGSLIGILISILLNFMVARARLKRDIRVNALIVFLNTKVGPDMPTVRDETIALIANQLGVFRDTYFSKFKMYTDEFRKITEALKEIHKAGFKDIMEKNTMVMARLLLYIERLDQLGETAKNIRFNPEVYLQFVKSSDELAQSNKNYVAELKKYGDQFNKINQSYVEVQATVKEGVNVLSYDKEIVAQFREAISRFQKTSVDRANQMTTDGENFDKSMQEYRSVYMNSVEEIRQEVVDKVKKTFSAEDYKVISDKLDKVAEALEKKSIIVEQAGNAVTEKGDQVSKDLQASLDKITGMLEQLRNTVEQKIPASLSDTVMANKQMVLETSAELLREPRSWGQWTYCWARKIVSKRSKKDFNGRRIGQ